MNMSKMSSEDVQMLNKLLSRAFENEIQYMNGCDHTDDPIACVRRAFILLKLHEDFAKCEKYVRDVEEFFTDGKNND
jgi:hypothetical protein